MITTTLEQSKALKELGAPQDTFFSWIAKPHGRVWNLANGWNHYNYKMVAAYTLSELIEWLGDGFRGLINFGDARYTTSDTEGYHGGDFYKTPLEAVFNLAIAVKSTQTGGEDK